MRLWKLKCDIEKQCVIISHIDSTKFLLHWIEPVGGEYGFMTNRIKQRNLPSLNQNLKDRTYKRCVKTKGENRA